MLLLTLRSLRAHRSRLTLTIVAVAAAVSFVTASFVLADSLRAVFGDVSDEIYQGVDAEIRAGEGTFDTVASGDRFDAASIESVSTIDGVASVTPSIGAENSVFAVAADGSALRQTGPPTLTFSTFGDSEASPFTITSGAAPGPGEVMLDSAQADALGLQLGDPVDVTGPRGGERFTLSGTVVFGVEESGVSPYFLLFDLTTMQRLLEAPGLIDGAAVVLEPGVDANEALEAITAELADGLVVVDRDTLVAEQNAEFGEVIDMVGVALLVFAAITLFVSTFVIANTFAVVVGQQRQQMGLLRAVGAGRAQATFVVVSEAAVVGLIASVLGLAGGLGVAEGIKALVEAVTTGGFPEGPTRLLPRTVVIALAVGVGVTTVAAIVPARRAGRVSPLAAMRPQGEMEVAGSSPGRSAVFAHRLSSATVGRLGPAGQIAATSIARNPRRVLATSMSMVVGLAVIASLAVLSTSYRSTLEEVTASGLDADVIVTGEDGVTVPYSVLTELGALPGIDAAAGFGVAEVLHDGQAIAIAGHQSGAAAGMVVLDEIEGAVGALAVDEVIVTEEFATDELVGVGDVVDVDFSDGHRAALVVRAVVEASTVVDAPLFVDEALVTAHARNVDAELGLVRFAEGVDAAVGQAAVAERLAARPQLLVESVDDHVAEQQAQADQIMMLANGLLALTIVVALVGIANTVALSLVERRSELGLLRAVGMSRRQVRRMVRYEAMVLSSVAATAGVGVGVVVALSISPLLPDTFVSSVEIPVQALAIYAVVCIGFGVLAAVLPARNAARLDVLDAIAVPT